MQNVERSRELLTKVNLIYGEIDAIYNSLHRELPALSPQGLLEKTAILEKLMEEAQDVDGRLANELQDADLLPSSIQELISIRKNRLEKLFQINRDLTGRAESSKALLRHELSTMRQNRSALQGYRPPDENGPGLIRTSF